MQLTEQQKAAVERIRQKNSGNPAAQNISREDARKLLGLEAMQKKAKENTTFLGRANEAIGSRIQQIGQTFGEAARGEITPVESAISIVGSAGAGITDIIGAAIEPTVAPVIERIAETELGAAAFQKIAEGVESWGKWKSESETNRRIGKTIEGLVNMSDLLGVAAFGRAGVKATGAIAKRTFDTTKDVAQRAQAVRAVLGNRAVQKETIEEAATSKGVVEKVRQSFFDNPTVTGAVDDIKIMVGLPDSAPAVDLTFRAVKPRIVKGRDLRRTKAQMELANQTLVENGFAPKSVKEYADAIYETKKSVWKEIESKLGAGVDQGLRVDLVPVAVDLLDLASDPALLRTNETAAKQIIEMAENLIKYGDDVDIIEAERIKQLINADLDGSFGKFDISEQAKNAKKKVTAYIGQQLDDKLAEIPGEFQALKNKYGALSSIEEDVLKRAVVFERRNPEGLADMLTKTEAAAEMAFGGTQGRLKGLARLTMQSRLKKANDADELIKRAFEKLRKDTNSQ